MNHLGPATLVYILNLNTIVNPNHMSSIRVPLVSDQTQRRLVDKLDDRWKNSQRASKKSSAFCLRPALAKDCKNGNRIEFSNRAFGMWSKGGCS